MRILAIETSTMLGGIAVMDESQGIIAEMRVNIRTTHSERLMTSIDCILKQARMGIHDIDVFGVSSGPGSFTGLRIGLSTAKGFAFATGKPIAAIPTLEAFAWSFPHAASPVCIMLDARKKEVYAAVFTWKDGNFKRVVGEALVNPADLAGSLKGPVIYAGEGALLYMKTITGIAGENAVFAPLHCMIPSPANVAYLCLKKAAGGDFEDPAALTPLYLRKSEAEIKLKI